jgi:hypothetical protein
MPENETLLAGFAVAAMLGLKSPRTLDNWRRLPPDDPRRALLPWVRFGKNRIRYKLSVVQNYIRTISGETIDIPSPKPSPKAKVSRKNQRRLPGGRTQPRR